MVGFLLLLIITWGERPHRILSRIALIWCLGAGKWFEEGSYCGGHLSNPSSLLKFTARPTDLLLRCVCVCVCICTPQKRSSGEGAGKHLHCEEPLIFLCLWQLDNRWSKIPMEILSTTGLMLHNLRGLMLACSMV